jgi:hypothetical protein
MDEIYIPLELENINRFKYDVDGINCNGLFTLSLSEINNLHTAILVSNSVEAFRIVNEMFWQAEFEKVKQKYGYEFIIQNTLVRVQNSNYLKYLSEISYDMLSPEKLIHIKVLGANQIIDIVSKTMPKFMIVGKN